MVSDRFESYLEKLVKKTEKHQIKWRPIKEYIDSLESPQLEIPQGGKMGIAQYVQFLTMEFSILNYEKSFFSKKDGYIIAVLDYKSISGKDDSVTNCLELVGGIYNSPVIRFPEYIEGGFARIQEAILEYWKFKEGDYNLEMSDNFELLRVFTED